MPGLRFIRHTATAVLPCCLAAVAAAGEAVPFAAPSQPAISDTASGVMRVPLALLLVLALVLGAGWLMRRATAARGGASQRIQILAQVSLGARERAVLIQVAGREVLLGVAPGNVRRLLVTTPNAEPDPASPIAGAAAQSNSFSASFKEVLRRSLGR